jgi:hypothetical protein
MHKRFLALFALACFALADIGCASKHVEYALMPLQTGSVLQRRVAIENSTIEDTKRPEKKRKEKKRPAPAPEEPVQQPEEESTPPPDRFR